MASTLEDLYREYNKQVYNLALQYVQNPEEAQEITQDVFVAVHQAMHTFKAEAKISTWLYRIAVNKSLDFLKARKRKKRFSFITSLFSTEDNSLKADKPSFDHPGVIMEQKEAVERIFSCINELSANQKTALILSKIEYKSLTEIADIMELSVKAVESLIQRAKTNLENKLKPAKAFKK